MKAVGYKKSLPITDTNALQDIELPQPVASGHDLLVKIKAIAVNPVDCKIRQRVAPIDDNYKVIGWDAVGEVVAKGNYATLFNVGDTVFYAGELNRSGCNAEYQLVDEKLAGIKPQNLSDTDAAALPLTSVTAWELLFKHLAIQPKAPNNIQTSKKESHEIILIVGAAGGVGSILIQLAKVLTNATVIATASRVSSQDWVKNLGADYVIDHSQPMSPQINALNIGPVTHIASLNGTDTYIDTYVELLAPFGKISLIDDPEPFDIKKLKAKSLSLHWTFMYTRSMFKTDDMNEQGNILNRVSELTEQGLIKTTIGKNLGTINAEHLRSAHQKIEAGSSIGKIVLEGF